MGLTGATITAGLDASFAKLNRCNCLNCERNHLLLHVAVTEFEPTRRLRRVRSPSAENSDDRVTKNDLQDLTAARRLHRGAVRLLCCAVLCVASVSAFAQDVSEQAAVTQPAAEADALPSGNLSALFDSEAADLAKAEVAKPKLSERIQGILSKAVTLLGTPYRWGGTSPEGGFDCSGLVGYVFRTALGVELPRVSREMAKNGELVSDRAALIAGDLVFFGRRGHVDHVGIYVGEGRFLHAPSTGKDVRVDNMSNTYWSGKFMQARRVAM